MSDCKFLTKKEYAYDVYKVPEDRYLCRNPKRMNAQDKMQSDRFVGKTDCDTCPFKEEEQTAQDNQNEDKD